MQGASVQNAPVGRSGARKQKTSFYAHNEGIGIRSCAAIYQVASETNTATGTALVNPNNIYQSVQLNLTDPAGLRTAGTKESCPFTSPIFDLIASAFVRYRVKKLVFHYEPQSNATTDARLVFAFANDPLHPLLWSSTPPDSSDLLALADSQPFMPWLEWSMDLTDKVSKDKLFTYSEASTTVGEFAERFSDFGVISCVTSLASQAATKLCGVLYMEIDIELSEFCPITVTRPSVLKSLENKVSYHHEQRMKRIGGRPPVATSEEVKEETREEICHTTPEQGSCSCKTDVADSS